MTGSFVVAPIQPKRRRRWRRVLAFFALLLLTLLLAASGVVWWAFRTNYLGDQISQRFHLRLPGYFAVGAVAVEASDQVILETISLAPARGIAPLFTARRIIISGPLWQGKVERIRIEGAKLYLSAGNVRFLKQVIDRETDIPASGPPEQHRLDIEGEAFLDGVPLAHDAVVGLVLFGPSATGSGRMILDGRPLEVALAGEGDGEGLHHRFALRPGGATLSVRTLCQRLAALELLPLVPDEAMVWIPEVVDAAGTVVVADRHWQHFTGEGHVTWPDSRIDAALIFDRRRLRLERLVVAAGKTLGTLEGVLAVDTQEQRVQVDANRWRPGPNAPLPAIVPTEAILAVMPQAVFEAKKDKTWSLGLRLSGTGQAKGHLTWSPGSPLLIEGSTVPLSLLQPFLPASLQLAAGHAARLQVAISDRLENLHAEVEQTRAMWNGWALGTVDATVDAKPTNAGFALNVNLMSLQGEKTKPLGKVGWTGTSSAGQLKLHLDDLEALLTRLKGPYILPELRGALEATIHMNLTSEGPRGRLEKATVIGGVVATIDGDEDRPGDPAKEPGQIRFSTVREILRKLDVVAEGPFSFAQGRLDARFTGRIARGELNLAEHWVDLAQRKPVFTCKLSAATGTVAVKELLLRATDARGAPLIDGYSAGLDVIVTTGIFGVTATGVVDHADLAWLASMLPQTEHRLRGEGAVTFTAKLSRQGQRIEGWFLPLDATLDLGSAFRATGISGAVQFLLSREGTR